jgi:hypothetical protein
MFISSHRSLVKSSTSKNGWVRHVNLYVVPNFSSPSGLGPPASIFLLRHACTILYLSFSSFACCIESMDNYRFPSGPWPAGTARSTDFWHGPWAGTARRPSCQCRHDTRPSAVFGPPAWPMARHGHGPNDPSDTGGTGRRGAQLPSPLAQRPAPAAIYKRRPGRVSPPPLPSRLALATPHPSLVSRSVVVTAWILDLELAASFGSTPVTSLLSLPPPASLSPLS